VGAGPPPILTEAGWIDIYHASDFSGRYCLGAMLTERGNPAQLIARSHSPVLAPEAEYETHGVYAPCVFAGGLVREEDETIRLYYGAADTSIACAETSVAELLSALS
jgi:predicted GH43/DUF377 family glycosyl hydrolase